MPFEQNFVKIVTVIFEERRLAVRTLDRSPVIIQPLLPIVYFDVGNRYFIVLCRKRNDQNIPAMFGIDITSVSKGLFYIMFMALKSHFHRR
jgi:hypothetical protein